MDVTGRVIQAEAGTGQVGDCAGSVDRRGGVILLPAVQKLKSAPDGGLRSPRPEAISASSARHWGGELGWFLRTWGSRARPHLQVPGNNWEQELPDSGRLWTSGGKLYRQRKGPEVTLETGTSRALVWLVGGAGVKGRGPGTGCGQLSGSPKGDIHRQCPKVDVEWAFNA